MIGNCQVHSPQKPPHILRGCFDTVIFAGLKASDILVLEKVGHALFAVPLDEVGDFFISQQGSIQYGLLVWAELQNSGLDGRRFGKGNVRIGDSDSFDSANICEE